VQGSAPHQKPVFFKRKGSALASGSPTIPVGTWLAMLLSTLCPSLRVILDSSLFPTLSTKPLRASNCGYPQMCQESHRCPQLLPSLSYCISWLDLSSLSFLIPSCLYPQNSVYYQQSADSGNVSQTMSLLKSPDSSHLPRENPKSFSGSTVSPQVSSLSDLRSSQSSLLLSL
jgi:hypothetical protein